MFARLVFMSMNFACVATSGSRTSWFSKRHMGPAYLSNYVIRNKTKVMIVAQNLNVFLYRCYSAVLSQKYVSY